jgi:hypothetical protein
MRLRIFPNFRRIHEIGLESFKEKSSYGNLRGCKQLSFDGNVGTYKNRRSICQWHNALRFLLEGAILPNPG